MMKIFFTLGTVLLIIGLTLITFTRVNAEVCQSTTHNYGEYTGSVSIPSTGTYAVWTRMKTLGINNSFWFSVDSGCPEVIGDNDSLTNSNWSWINSKSDSPTTPYIVNLTAGNHTITVIGKEPGVSIDRILFLSDTTCQPTDMGGNCLTSPSPTAQITLSPTATTTTSLLSNGGFEQDLTNWYTTTQEAEITTTSVYSGQKAIKLLPSTEAYISQKPTLTPNQSYTVSGWGKVDASTTGYIGVSFWDSANVKLTSQYSQQFTTQTYTKQSLTFTIPANAARSEVWYYKDATEGAFYADEMIVTSNQPTQTPIPTLTNTPVPTLTNTPTPTTVPTSTPRPTNTPSPTPVAGTNLLKNPGLELGDNNNWYREGASAIVSNNAQAGTYAARLGTDSSGYMDQKIATSVSTTYRLTVYGKMTGSDNTGSVGIMYRNSAGTRLTSSEPAKINFTETAYTQKSLTFTVPSTATQVWVYLTKTGSTRYFYADSVSVVKQ